MAMLNIAPQQAGTTPSCYGTGAGHRLPAIALVLAMHAALATLLLQHNGSSIKKRVEHLEIMNLSAQSPLPEPQRASPAPPVASAIVAPARKIEIPTPAATPLTMAAVSAPVSVPRIVNAVADAPSQAVMPSAAPAHTATVDGGDMGTQMIEARPPKYPIESRRKREQGIVVLAITLGTDGRVNTLAVARSSGFARLDDAARHAVRHWRWSPTLRDGQPVMVRGTVEIPFVLAG